MNDWTFFDKFIAIILTLAAIAVVAHFGPQLYAKFSNDSVKELRQATLNAERATFELQCLREARSKLACDLYDANRLSK